MTSTLDVKYRERNVKEPGAAETARARHRRVQLLCAHDPTELPPTLAQLRWQDPMRDRRHERSRAYPEIMAWINYLELRGKSARTQYAYERATAPLLRHHPGKLLADIRADEINAELAAIPPRSHYISRSIYNQLFKWADKKNRLVDNPMKDVEELSAGKRRLKNIFEPAEVAILEATPVPDGPLWSILYGRVDIEEVARKVAAL